MYFWEIFLIILKYKVFYYLIFFCSAAEIILSKIQLSFVSVKKCLDDIYATVLISYEEKEPH